MGGFQQPGHGLFDLFIRHQDDIAHQPAHDVQGHLRRHPGRQTLGDGVERIVPDDFPGLPGFRYRGRPCGLNPYHLCAGVAFCRDNGRAANAAAQADRDNYRVGRRFLVEYFVGHGADSGDQHGLVGGMYVTQSSLLRQLLAIELRLVEILAMLDQFGAQRPHGVDLSRVVVLRHDQGATDAELPRRISQRLPVIAGGATDDALLHRLFGQAAHQVDAAAHLERPGGLVVLVFQQVAETEPLFQQRPFIQQGRTQVLIYPLAGLGYVMVARRSH